VTNRDLNLNTVVVAGAVIAASYVIYQIFSTAQKGFSTVQSAAGAVVDAAGNAYTSARDAVASGLYALFGPEDRSGPNTYYTITFPDGLRHAIGADVVDANGNFTWTGFPVGSSAPVKLRIVKDSSGAKFAVSA